MLMGTYEHRLDSKARLVLPAKIREKLGDVVVVTAGMDKCVSLFSEAEWINFSANFRNVPYYSNPESRGVVRFMIGSAHEMPIDGTGRVLLPTPLRDYAGLQPGQEVVVSGVIDHVEVWNKDSWEEKRDAVVENLSELAKGMGF